MNIKLYNKSFLTLLDFSAEEIYYLLKLAHELKSRRKQGFMGNTLHGKNVAILFEKSSTRTRCAFEISVIEEGGYASFIDISNTQFGQKESVEDSAKVLSGFYHAIAYRGYSQRTIEKLAHYSQIPVYNGLTDDDHPTQILADLMTIQEHLDKPLFKVKIAYIGDTRNNMCNAWMYGAAKLGMHFVAYGPKELAPNQLILNQVRSIAIVSGGRIEISSDVNILLGADVIYTDVWVSMGEEDQILNRANLLKDYQVTIDMIKATHNPNVLFMHCLPAFHDNATNFIKNVQNTIGIDICEVSNEVFHSDHSIVFEQSENRLHTIKAILVATIGKQYY